MTPTTPLPPAAETALFELRRHWPWLIAGLAILVLLVLLAPILTPFAVGAGLAYLGDPVVDWLERRRLSRTLAVSLVFVVLSVVFIAIVLLLVPMLYEQLLALLSHIPEGLLYLQDRLLPQLGVQLPDGLRLDAQGLRSLLLAHWQQAGGVLQAAWLHVSQSGLRLLAALANLLLIPIVAFYLLRDWDRFIASIRSLIPPRYLARTSQLARESDEVLGAFIRGQLSVMAALALYYAVALWLAGLELALLVGVIVGLISFVPYLGAIVGLLTAGIAMLVQTQDASGLVAIAIVFAIGQFLEGNVLTPWLVGDRIGLHPVTVIFAVMAGGQLFGFVGVLLALPAAAVIAVLLRHVREQWHHSPLYTVGAPAPCLPPDPAPPAPPVE